MTTIDIKKEFALWLSWEQYNTNEYSKKYYRNIINNNVKSMFEKFPLYKYGVYMKSKNTENVKFQFNNGFIGNIPYNRLVKYTTYTYAYNDNLNSEILSLDVNDKIWICFNMLCFFGKTDIRYFYENIINLSMDELCILFKLTRLLKMISINHIDDDDEYFNSYQKYLNENLDIFNSDDEEIISNEFPEIISNEFPEIERFDYCEKDKKDMFDKGKSLLNKCINTINDYISKNITYKFDNKLVNKLLEFEFGMSENASLVISPKYNEIFKFYIENDYTEMDNFNEIKRDVIELINDYGKYEGKKIKEDKKRFNMSKYYGY
jgi:hypothetical protein